MEDVWRQFPQDPGPLVDAVAHGIAQAQPPEARPRPYQDPLEWTMLKHAAQLALAASVLLFVLQGGAAPLMALTYVATGLLLVVVVVVADRQRFGDRDPAFDIVEFVAPPPAPARPAMPAVRQGPLAPLALQMGVVLDCRVDVT